MVRSAKQYQMKGRFYLFAAVFVVLVVLLCVLIFRQHKAYIRYGALSDSRIYDAVVVFDESREVLPAHDKILDSLASGQRVAAGDLVATVYKKGYILSAEQAIRELYTSVYRYQEENLIRDIYKPELTQYALNLRTLLGNLQAYRYGQEEFTLKELENQLRDCMLERQNFIRNNFTADSTLLQMYSDLAERELSMADWRQEIRAEQDGFVLWQDPGVTGGLNYESLQTVTAGELSRMLRNTHVLRDASYSEQNSVRLIRDGSVCFAMPYQRQMNLEQGRGLTLYVRGVDKPVLATVVRLDKRENVVVFRVEGITEQLLGKRFVQIGTAPIHEGLIIPQACLETGENGDYQVLVQDGNKKTAVPVRVLAQMDNQVLIEPKTEHALHISQVIYG